MLSAIDGLLAEAAVPVPDPRGFDVAAADDQMDIDEALGVCLPAAPDRASGVGA